MIKKIGRLLKKSSNLYLKSLSTLVYNVLKMANSYQFFNRRNESS